MIYNIFVGVVIFSGVVISFAVLGYVAFIVLVMHVLKISLNKLNKGK